MNNYVLDSLISISEASRQIWSAAIEGSRKDSDLENITNSL